MRRSISAALCLFLLPVSGVALSSAPAAAAAPAPVRASAPPAGNEVVDEGWSPRRHWVERADGTVTVEVFQRPAFTRRDGRWQRFDGTPRREGGAVVSDGAAGRITFRRAAEGPTVTFDVAGKRVSMAAEGLASTEPVVDGDVVTYPGVAPGADLAYQVTADGVKEQVVLHTPSAPLSYRFHIADPAKVLGVPRQTADGGWAFGKSGFRLGAPTAYEQAAPGDNPGSASLTVRRAGNGYDVVESVDEEWLKGKTYPIVLDPSVTVEKAPSVDTQIANGTLAGNTYGSQTTMDVGYGAYGGTTAVRRSLVSSADLTSSIPTGAVVTAAALSLHTTAIVSGTSVSVKVARPGKAWASGASWNYATSPGTPTPVAWVGGNPIATTATATTVNAAGARFSWSIKGIAQDWVNGKYPSHGLLLQSATEGTASAVRFATQSSTNSTHWPKMTVTYEKPAVTASWKSLAPVTSPGPRSHYSAVYDSDRDEVVLFGGLSSSTATSYLSDTWTWNGLTWVKKTPATEAYQRGGAAAAYDPVRKEMVIFGGMLGTGGNSTTNYTATWDGTTWANRSLTTKPGGRASAAMAWHPTLQQAVLFGGSINGGYWGDTWAWNGTSWAQQLSGAGPSPRDGAAMAYLPSIGKMVLFGGMTASGANGETWLYDATAKTWTQVTSLTHTPPPRTGGSLSYDERTGKLMLFGGHGYNDTWLFDGTTWTSGGVLTSGSPSPRGSMTAVYDPSRGQHVLFGGYTTGTVHSDMWAYETVAAPSAPTNVTATGGDSSATVSWDAAKPNGAPVTSYTVTATPGGATKTVTGVTTTVFEGLTNGTSYTFAVTATNSAGTSPAATSNAVVPAAKPSAPANVAATAGDKQASVSWSPSAGNGAAVTKYTVTAVPAPTGSAATREATGTQTSLVFDGLTNGTSYTFTVTATNSAGTSDPSAPSNSVTPHRAGGPDAPVVASSTHQQDVWSSERDASFTWDVPAEASPLRGYSVIVDQSAVTVPDETSDTLFGAWSANDLTDGEHWIHVRAADSVGNWGATGHYRVRVDGTTPAAPAAVSTTHPDPTVVYAGDTPAFQWTGPNPVSGVAGYSYVFDTEESTVPPETASGTETTMSAGRQDIGIYYLHVRAVSGSGLWSPTAHVKIMLNPFVGGTFRDDTMGRGTGAASGPLPPAVQQATETLVPPPPGGYETLFPPVKQLGQVLDTGGLLGADPFFDGPVLSEDNPAESLMGAMGAALPPTVEPPNPSALAGRTLSELRTLPGVVPVLDIVPLPVYQAETVVYDANGQPGDPQQSTFTTCAPTEYDAETGLPAAPTTGDLRINFCPDASTYQPTNPYEPRRLTYQLDALRPGVRVKVTVSYAVGSEQLRLSTTARTVDQPVEDGTGAAFGSDSTCDNTTRQPLPDVITTPGIVADTDLGYCIELLVRRSEDGTQQVSATTQSSGRLDAAELWRDVVDSGGAFVPANHIETAPVPVSPRHQYIFTARDATEPERVLTARITLVDTVPNPGESVTLEQFDTTQNTILRRVRLTDVPRHFSTALSATLDPNASSVATADIVEATVSGGQPAAPDEVLSVQQYEDGVLNTTLRIDSFAPSYQYDFADQRDGEGRREGARVATWFPDGVPAGGSLELALYRAEGVLDSKLAMERFSTDTTFALRAHGNPEKPTGFTAEGANAEPVPAQVVQLVQHPETGSPRRFALVGRAAASGSVWPAVAGQNVRWDDPPTNYSLHADVVNQTAGAATGQPGTVTVSGTGNGEVRPSNRLEISQLSGGTTIGLVAAALTADHSLRIDVTGTLGALTRARIERDSKETRPEQALQIYARDAGGLRAQMSLLGPDAATGVLEPGVASQLDGRATNVPGHYIVEANLTTTDGRPTAATISGRNFGDALTMTLSLADRAKGFSAAFRSLLDSYTYAVRASEFDSGGVPHRAVIEATDQSHDNPTGEVELGMKGVRFFTSSLTRTFSYTISFTGPVSDPTSAALSQRQSGDNPGQLMQLAAYGTGQSAPQFAATIRAGAAVPTLPTTGRHADLTWTGAPREYDLDLGRFGPACGENESGGGASIGTAYLSSDVPGADLVLRQTRGSTRQHAAFHGLSDDARLVVSYCGSLAAPRSVHIDAKAGTTRRTSDSIQLLGYAGETLTQRFALRGTASPAPDGGTPTRTEGEYLGLPAAVVIDYSKQGTAGAERASISSTAPGSDGTNSRLSVRNTDGNTRQELLMHGLAPTWRMSLAYEGDAGQPVADPNAAHIETFASVRRPTDFIELLNFVDGKKKHKFLFWEPLSDMPLVDTADAVSAEYATYPEHVVLDYARQKDTSVTPHRDMKYTLKLHTYDASGNPVRGTDSRLSAKLLVNGESSDFLDLEDIPAAIEEFTYTYPSRTAASKDDNCLGQIGYNASDSGLRLHLHASTHTTCLPDEAGTGFGHFTADMEDVPRYGFEKAELHRDGSGEFLMSVGADGEREAVTTLNVSVPVPSQTQAFLRDNQNLPAQEFCPDLVPKHMMCFTPTITSNLDYPNARIQVDATELTSLRIKTNVETPYSAPESPDQDREIRQALWSHVPVFAVHNGSTGDVNVHLTGNQKGAGLLEQYIEAAALNVELTDEDTSLSVPDGTPLGARFYGWDVRWATCAVDLGVPEGAEPGDFVRCNKDGEELEYGFGAMVRWGSPDVPFEPKFDRSAYNHADKAATTGFAVEPGATSYFIPNPYDAILSEVPGDGIWAIQSAAPGLYSSNWLWEGLLYMFPQDPLGMVNQ